MAAKAETEKKEAHEKELKRIEEGKKAGEMREKLKVSMRALQCDVSSVLLFVRKTTRLAEQLVKIRKGSMSALSHGNTNFLFP